jgi:phosphoglycolate phosphatase
MRPVRLVVTDLDNTLYSWVGYVVYAIEAMVESLSATTRLGPEEILDSLREVYAARGSIEYPFVIQEAEVFRERARDFERFAEEVLVPARRAFAQVRRRLLRPFDGVVETLQELERLGIPAVGLSDASSFGATLRLRLLGLDRHLAALYAIEPYPLPPPERLERRILEKLEAGLYKPESLHVVDLPVHAVKPSPHGYERICRDFAVSPEETVMIGDNVSKDLGVAEAVGARGVWAEYGTWMSLEVRERLERYVPNVVLKRNAPELEPSSTPPREGVKSYLQLLTQAGLAGR